MPEIELIPIPADSRAVQCRYCPAIMYWSRHPRTGSKVPVSVTPDAEGQRPPSRHDAGAGVNHFTTCPGADAARKSR